MLVKIACVVIGAAVALAVGPWLLAPAVCSSFLFGSIAAP